MSKSSKLQTWKTAILCRGQNFITETKGKSYKFVQFCLIGFKNAQNVDWKNDFFVRIADPNQFSDISAPDIVICSQFVNIYIIGIKINDTYFFKLVI